MRDGRWRFGSEEARVLAGVAETARVINCAKARLDDEDAREDRGGEDVDVDRILDKINEHGLQSLTEEERKFLSDSGNK